MKSSIFKLLTLSIIIVGSFYITLPQITSADSATTPTNANPGALVGTAKDAGSGSSGNVVSQYKLLVGGLVGKSDCIPDKPETCGSVSNIEEYANLFFNSLLALTVLLSIMMMVFGGVKYISSEALNTKNDGKSAMMNALMGLALALTAYLILRSIDPKLVGNWELSKSLPPKTTTSLPYANPHPTSPIQMLVQPMN